jgi:hypothetical protein
MRDFRDAKSMAQTLRAALAAKGVKISIGESLELIARTLGAADWNTLSAAIKSAGAEKSTEPAAQPPPLSGEALNSLAVHLGWPSWERLTAALQTVRAAAPGRVTERAERPASEPPPPTEPAEPARRGGTRFSAELTETLHRSVAFATERKHTYTTIEHLLLALTDDQDAATVMEACEVDIASLRAAVTQHVDEELTQIVGTDGREPTPTAGFHRVVQRSVIHVQSSGRGVVTGANLLVAIFSERESRACQFLDQRMTRFDAVNFIAHGVRKGGAAA